jgi:hypothetical protein
MRRQHGAEEESSILESRAVHTMHEPRMFLRSDTDMWKDFKLTKAVQAQPVAGRRSALSRATQKSSQNTMGHMK